MWSNAMLPKMKILTRWASSAPVRIPTIESIGEDGKPVVLIDPDTMVEPQPNYFPVDKVWGYEHGVWYCLLTNERSEVKKGGQWVNEGLVMWIVDDQKCYRAAQYGEGVEAALRDRRVFRARSRLPAVRLPDGYADLEGGRVVYQSVYHLPAKPAFDTVLLDTTYLSMVKSNSAYPHR